MVPFFFDQGYGTCAPEESPRLKHGKSGLGLMWLRLKMIHLKDWWLEWHHLTIQLEYYQKWQYQPLKLWHHTTNVYQLALQNHLTCFFSHNFCHWSQSPQGVLEEIDLMCNKSTIDDFVRLDADHSGLIVSCGCILHDLVVGETLNVFRGHDILLSWLEVWIFIFWNLWHAKVHGWLLALRESDLKRLNPRHHKENS